MLNDLNTEIKNFLYSNRSYNLFLTFAQRATFGIKVNFEQIVIFSSKIKNKFGVIF